MKKLLSISLVLLLCLSALAGCGKKADTSSNKSGTASKSDEETLNGIWGSEGSTSGSVTADSPAVSDKDKIYDRILFSTGLSDYITLGDYKGLEVDTAGDEYAEAYETVLSSDLESLGGYARSTEGTVADGDTVNITFVGKKDGVAFEGGSGTSDLTIGSGSFIDGFEDGLIGVDVGETVDLNLTFPDPYENNPDLAGKAVVFTVTVNNIVTDKELTTDTAYADMGFDSEEEYLEELKKSAVCEVLFAKVTESCKITNHPQADLDYLYKQAKASLEAQYASYGMTFETLLSYSGMTEDDYIDQVITPTLEQMMIFYAIMDDIGVKVTDKDISAKAEEIAEESGGYTADDVIESYGKYYVEYYAVSETVLDYLYENAKIK